jgi:hypothetical protein
MTRARLVMLVVLCAFWPTHAFAQIDPIEWLQDGSGPGPYRNVGRGFFVRLFCVKEDPNGRHRVDTCIADTDDSIKIVVEAQYAFVSTENPRFNDAPALTDPFNNSPINVNRFDVMYSYRVSPLLDLGVGIGTYTYSGNGFENQTRLTVTPFQLSFVPLGYFGGDTGKKWGRVLRLKYANHRVIGDLLGSDYGSKSTYVSRGGFNQSLSVSLDFWSFIAAIHK